MPIFVADYVLVGYGTGAIMAVPAHDERDFEFATKFGIKIVPVIEPVPAFVGAEGGETLADAQLKVEENTKAIISGKKLYTGPGTLINSGDFTGMESEIAKKAITEKVGGTMTSTYKIRDWVFSRQRYWGEPIPIIHCEKCGPVAVPDDELPVKLPEVERYEPTGTGESPLANIHDWVNTICPNCGAPGKRETNTMPQWAGSSWYYLRYIDPKNNEALVGKEKEKYWAPVDVYVGGDHAVRHLIYARFWHKFLYDIGIVSTIEPFQRLEFLGFILAEDGRKMSKRWGNVINPDDIVEQVGADTLRVYEMFMGPFENTIAWSKDGVVGARRFLERVNGLKEHIVKEESDNIKRQLHKTIKKVSSDIENFKFNTAVSAMMIFLNQAEKDGLTSESYLSFLKLLSPFAPFLTEELWSENNKKNSIHTESFPKQDETLAKADEVTIGVQINGKLRGSITLPVKATESEAMALAQRLPSIQKSLEAASIKKVIYVQGRILNLIA
jgi:leucyl-tRNA synthetase